MKPTYPTIKDIYRKFGIAAPYANYANETRRELLSMLKYKITEYNAYDVIEDLTIKFESEVQEAAFEYGFMFALSLFKISGIELPQDTADSTK